MALVKEQREVEKCVLEKTPRQVTHVIDEARLVELLRSLPSGLARLALRGHGNNEALHLGDNGSTTTTCGCRVVHSVRSRREGFGVTLVTMGALGYCLFRSSTEQWVKRITG